MRHASHIRRVFPPLLLGLAATLIGCSALYDAGFRSNEARYEELAAPDVSGLSPEEAQEKIDAAENHARRVEFIERQRKLRQLGGGARTPGG
ncbi:hypothetical protein [Algisphaera agarilytica]|uniref:Lipoprotein n=1 Tax=Algisphaera agarilytica TaxID=1385975 RepID=A0A7X0H3P4_9BACT|nr:hypothetical protein [Algisphaera agarilytica]MBB6428482.1 hypothetical protein [Algisphaera agarilytica]